MCETLSKVYPAHDFHFASASDGVSRTTNCSVTTTSNSRSDSSGIAEHRLENCTNLYDGMRAAAAGKHVKNQLGKVMF